MLTGKATSLGHGSEIQNGAPQLPIIDDRFDVVVARKGAVIGVSAMAPRQVTVLLKNWKNDVRESHGATVYIGDWRFFGAGG